MSLNQYIVRVSPGLLRFYRTRLLLDLPELMSYLPEQGSVLDVGCAIGSTDYTIAATRPELDITGIDINEGAIAQANRYNAGSNVRYRAVRMEEMEGRFDCITLMDLLHHMSEEDARALLEDAPRLLKPGGFIVIKDIDRRGGTFSYVMDKYVTRAMPVNLRTPDELRALIPDSLSVVAERRKWRFPQPHLYFKLVPAAAGP